MGLDLQEERQSTREVSGMEGMGLGWNQETSRRWLGEEDDPVGEGRVVGRGWGGQGSGKGADP